MSPRTCAGTVDTKRKKTNRQRYLQAHLGFLRNRQRSDSPDQKSSCPTSEKDPRKNSYLAVNRARKNISKKLQGSEAERVQKIKPFSK